jgi:hypothetical protein
MKRVVVLSLCVLGVIAVTLFASGEFAHIQKKRKAASDIRRCGERLAGLRRDLPVGTWLWPTFTHTVTLLLNSVESQIPSRWISEGSSRWFGFVASGRIMPF